MCIRDSTYSCYSRNLLWEVYSSHIVTTALTKENSHYFLKARKFLSGNIFNTQVETIKQAPLSGARSDILGRFIQMIILAQNGGVQNNTNSDVGDVSLGI